MGESANEPSVVGTEIEKSSHFVHIGGLWPGGRPASTQSMRRSNGAGALYSPKGITVNCHKASPVVKAVFSLS